jgi:hypothetical protein
VPNEVEDVEWPYALIAEASRRQEKSQSTGFAQPGERKYRCPQPGAVNGADVFEIQYYIDLGGLIQVMQPVAPCQILPAPM